METEILTRTGDWFSMNGIIEVHFNGRVRARVYPESQTKKSAAKVLSDTKHLRNFLHLGNYLQCPSGFRIGRAWGVPQQMAFRQLQHAAKMVVTWHKMFPPPSKQSLSKIIVIKVLMLSSIPETFLFPRNVCTFLWNTLIITCSTVLNNNQLNNNHNNEFMGSLKSLEWEMD